MRRLLFSLAAAAVVTAAVAVIAQPKPEAPPPTDDEKRFDLTTQPCASWLWDQTKAFAVTVLIFAPLGALALLGIRRIRRWWLVLWLASIPLSVFFVIIAPVFLDPIFNKFTKLQDPVLEK